MSTLKNILNDKIVKAALEIIIFIMFLPIINIVIKSIFALGQALGTYTRIIGY